MKIIGITGGIGAGKSTILAVLEREPESFVLEADSLAHCLMERGKVTYEKIVDAFGTNILDDSGSINRELLGKLVFESENALEKLNGIVHPAVKAYILDDIEKKSRENYQYYIIEAALLIEDGYKSVCDEIWYIYADKEERIRRLMASRGGSREKWEAIILNQSGDDFYRQHCDRIIRNVNNLEELEGIVKELLCKC